MLHFSKEEIKVMRMRWLELSIKNIITDDCTRNTKMGIPNLDCGKLRKEVQRLKYLM